MNVPFVIQQYHPQRMASSNEDDGKSPDQQQSPNGSSSEVPIRTLYVGGIDPDVSHINTLVRTIIFNS